MPQSNLFSGPFFCPKSHSCKNKDKYEVLSGTETQVSPDVIIHQSINHQSQVQLPVPGDLVGILFQNITIAAPSVLGEPDVLWGFQGG